MIGVREAEVWWWDRKQKTGKEGEEQRLRFGRSSWAQRGSEGLGGVLEVTPGAVGVQCVITSNLLPMAD